MKLPIYRSIFSVTTGAMALLAAGCVSYKPAPLPLQGYNSVLSSRSTASADVAESTSITLPEAERIALYFNPRLRAARQLANVQTVEVEHSGLWDDPVLSGDILRLFKNEPHRWIMGGALLFSIPISGRLSVQKSLATNESKAAIVSAWGEEQMVLRELRESWSEWSAAREGRTVLSSERARYDNASSYMSSRPADRQFAATDRSMLRNSSSRVNLEDSRLVASEERARMRIIALMGMTFASDIQPVPTTELAAWEGNVDDIYNMNPTVMLREAEYQVAEESLRLEVRKQYPDLAIGPAYERRGGDDRFGLGFSIPIPILNGNRGNIARAAAERDAARVAWEASVEDAFHAYAVAYTGRAVARNQADSLRGVISETETQSNESRRRLEANDHNTMLIVDSANNERDSRLSLVESNAMVQRYNAALWSIVPSEIPVVAPQRSATGSSSPTTETIN